MYNQTNISSYNNEFLLPLGKFETSILKLREGPEEVPMLLKKLESTI